MDVWKFFAITHADHVLCNPMSPDRLDELVGLLDLAPGARAWEAGCGKGELLIRLADRYQAAGVGVDTSPFELRVARDRAAARVPAADLEFVEGDAAERVPEPGSVDLAACVGASWIWGGHRGTLRALRAAVRPGGLVLVGEPYWRCDPAPEYLAAAGCRAEDFSTLHGNVAIGSDEGLTLLYVMPSSDADWDRYEMLRLRAAERHAASQPADPDAPELLERARRDAEAYLRWGRATMGWAIYLFRAPA
jgi:SAM-dependent methyltransferase